MSLNDLTCLNRDGLILIVFYLHSYEWVIGIEKRQVVAVFFCLRSQVNKLSVWKETTSSIVRGID